MLLYSNLDQYHSNFKSASEKAQSINLSFAVFSRQRLHNFVHSGHYEEFLSQLFVPTEVRQYAWIQICAQTYCQCQYAKRNDEAELISEENFDKPQIINSNLALSHNHQEQQKIESGTEKKKLSDYYSTKEKRIEQLDQKDHSIQDENNTIEISLKAEQYSQQIFQFRNQIQISNEKGESKILQKEPEEEIMDFKQGISQ